MLKTRLLHTPRRDSVARIERRDFLRLSPEAGFRSPAPDRRFEPLFHPPGERRENAKNSVFPVYAGFPAPLGG